MVPTVRKCRFVKNLSVHKSLGLDEMLLRVLRELATCATPVKYLVGGKRSPLTNVMAFYKGVTTWDKGRE